VDLDPTSAVHRGISPPHTQLSVIHESGYWGRGPSRSSYWWEVP
jgi:hypothetical protein